MKLAIFAISALALAGCGGAGSGGLSKSNLSVLPVTATMPKGAASYVGKFEGRAANATISLVETADWSLAANFDAKTVQASMANYARKETISGTAYELKTTGTATGNGTINGATINIPSVKGTLFATSVTANGVSMPIVNPVLNYTSAPITASFVGANAEGIYGSGAVSGGSYEIYGTKQ